MNIYNYSPLTGEFTGISPAPTSPQEPGGYLLPANATTTAPPTPGTDQCAAWSAGAWTLVPDYRGQRWYQPDGTQVDITALNVIPDPTWTQTQPPPTPAQQWASYQKQALMEIMSSDTTMHRVAEGVALGKTTWATADVVAFVQWRQALRAILSEAQPSTIPTALPTKPAYPAGT